jgi:hypothetical protein
MADRAVYKTFDVEVLDDFYSGDPPTSLTVALRQGDRLLNASASAGLSAGFAGYKQFPQQLGGGTTPQEFNAWLAAGGAAAERIVRLGYKEAVRRARNRTLPIDTFFVAGASEEFELHVCEGERRVTVFIFMPEGRPYGSRRASSTSWIFRTARDDDRAEPLDDEDPRVVMIQRSGPDGPAAS